MNRIVGFFAALILFIGVSAACRAAPPKPDDATISAYSAELSVDIAKSILSDNDEVIDEEWMANWFAEGNRIERYRVVLSNQSGVSDVKFEGKEIMSIDWESVRELLTTALDTAEARMGAVLCENHRALLFGVDVATTAATIVIGVLTGGVGAAAIGAGKAGLQSVIRSAAAKLAVKGIGGQVVKLGAKKTATRVATWALREAAKKGLAGAAANAAASTATRAAAALGFKQALTAGVSKGVASAIGAGLLRKVAGMAADGVFIWAVGMSNSSWFGLIDSTLRADLPNCADLDSAFNKCYSICGKGDLGDDLNKYVFDRLLHKKVCVGDKRTEEQYVVFEVAKDGSRIPLVMTQTEANMVYAKLPEIKNKGNCNRNNDDLDIYFGYYFYDPDTLLIDGKHLGIKNAFRIDNGVGSIKKQ
ncbi:MAG: hypothetical protein LBL46_02840 [Rickettsiales bacterium]|jgi:hypothetical protein|nr:hypothetical protein [Rickettsiales bacterium]